MEYYATTLTTTFIYTMRSAGVKLTLFADVDHRLYAQGDANACSGRHVNDELAFN